MVRATFEAVWNTGGTVAIASAGLDFYIGPVLKKAGLDRTEINCGRVVSGPAQSPPFRYDYPSREYTAKADPCKGDWVTCKCGVICGLKRDGGESEIIFVGDGMTSDTCAAANAADIVFATGRLLDYCDENGIEATGFDKDFGPVLRYVTDKISAGGDR